MRSSLLLILLVAGCVSKTPVAKQVPLPQTPVLSSIVASRDQVSQPLVHIIQPISFILSIGWDQYPDGYGMVIQGSDDYIHFTNEQSLLTDWHLTDFTLTNSNPHHSYRLNIP